MTKRELRAAYKQQRMLLSKEEISSYNLMILQALEEFDWSTTKYVHTFLPIEHHNEPDMWRFIDFLRVYYPAVNVVVSRSDASNFSMDNFLLTEGLTLKKNAWGIVEPVDGERIEESLLDVVIVPLLVADKKGNRVGYGKGFYDRFLAKCRKDCLKIGISYFEPVDEISDVSMFDIPLDCLYTPQMQYRF